MYIYYWIKFEDANLKFSFQRPKIKFHANLKFAFCKFARKFGKFTRKYTKRGHTTVVSTFKNTSRRESAFNTSTFKTEGRTDTIAYFLQNYLSIIRPKVFSCRHGEENM